MLSPPSGLTRLIFRLPIFVYSMRAGWLFDGRALLLEHRGRKSGKMRRAVLEVIGKRPEEGVYYVAAAWAPTADWYRNIRADPNVKITVGSRRFAAVAAPLTPEESRIVLEEYARKYAMSARAGALLLRISKEELIATTHVVELRRRLRAAKNRD